MGSVGLTKAARRTLVFLALAVEGVLGRFAPLIARGSPPRSSFLKPHKSAATPTSAGIVVSQFLAKTLQSNGCSSGVPCSNDLAWAKCACQPCRICVKRGLPVRQLIPRKTTITASVNKARLPANARKVPGAGVPLVDGPREGRNSSVVRFELSRKRRSETKLFVASGRLAGELGRDALAACVRRQMI